MKKISVSGPSIDKIMSTFSKSIVHGTSSTKIKFTSATSPQIDYEVVIDKINATIWNLPPSHFNNEPNLRKHLIFDGWINSEKGKKFHNMVTRRCKVEIYADGTIWLQKKRK